VCSAASNSVLCGLSENAASVTSDIPGHLFFNNLPKKHSVLYTYNKCVAMTTKSCDESKASNHFPDLGQAPLSSWLCSRTQEITHLCRERRDLSGEACLALTQKVDVGQELVNCVLTEGLELAPLGNTKVMLICH
jgi:hypothetical protein